MTSITDINLEYCLDMGLDCKIGPNMEFYLDFCLYHNFYLNIVSKIIFLILLLGSDIRLSFGIKYVFILGLLLIILLTLEDGIRYGSVPGI